MHLLQAFKFSEQFRLDEGLVGLYIMADTRSLPAMQQVALGSLFLAHLCGVLTAMS